VTDEHTLWRESAPIRREELPAVSQRTEAQGFVLTPRLAHEDTSGLPLADVVEAGSARKILFSRL